jgi:SAM-dependent methyltransferase
VAAQPYDREFFAALDAPANSSAQAVLPLLWEVAQPKSVIDVGCGTGAWLAVARGLGAERTLGIDGEFARDSLRIPVEEFRAADLAEPLTLAERFDLCLSLEVAEHLPPERAASFVADLTRLAPFIAFSAAVPCQGGVNHVNEQWADYWHALFARHSYRPLDVIRARVWDNPEVVGCYAQNTFLYTSAATSPREQPLPTRIVHPKVLTTRVTRLEREAEHARPIARLRARVQLRGRIRRMLRKQ